MIDIDLGDVFSTDNDNKLGTWKYRSLNVLSNDGILRDQLKPYLFNSIALQKVCPKRKKV